MLGERSSGNGDFLLAGTGRANREIDPGSGPRITAIADFSTASNKIFIEDLGFPDPFLWYLEGSLPTPGRFRNLKSFVDKYILRTLGLSKASAFTDGVDQLFQGGLTPKFLPYLGMGTDAADGKVRLSGGNIDIQWNPRNTRKML
jgi:cholesterol oxidase